MWCLLVKKHEVLNDFMAYVSKFMHAIKVKGSIPSYDILLLFKNCEQVQITADQATAATIGPHAPL